MARRKARRKSAARKPKVRETLPGEPAFKQAVAELEYDYDEIEAIFQYYQPRLKAGENVSIIIDELRRNPPDISDLLETEEDEEEEPEEEQPRARRKRVVAVEAQPQPSEDEGLGSELSEEAEKLRQRRSYEDVKTAQAAPDTQPEQAFAAPKPKEQIRLEKEIEKLKGAVEFLEEKVKTQDEKYASLLEEQRKIDVDRIFFKGLAYSAFSHTDIGQLLVLERRSIRDALKKGSSGEVLWEDDNGKPVVYSSKQAAEDKALIPLQRRENELIQRKVNADEKTKVEINRELKDIFDKTVYLKRRINAAEDSIVYPSVLRYQKCDKREPTEIEQDPSVLESLEVDEKTGEVKGAGKLIRKPIQRSLEEIELDKDSLDIRIIRYYIGGLVAKQASETTKKKTKWGESTGLRMTDKELEDYALKGLETQVENATLKANLETSDRDKRELRKQVGSLEGEVKPLRQQVESLEKKGTQARTEIENLRAENTRQEEEITKLNARFELAQQYSKELEERLTSSDSELSGKREELARVNEELAQIKQLLEQGRDSLPKQLRAEYRRGKSEGREEAVAEYDKELKKIQRQREKERKDLEAKLKEAATKGEARQILMEELRKRLKHDYEIKLDRKDLEIEGLKGIQKKLEDQVRILNNRHTKEEYDDVVAQSKAKDKQIEELQRRPTEEKLKKDVREVRDFYQRRLDEYEERVRAYEQEVHKFVEDLRKGNHVREDKLVKAITGIYETALKDVINETITLEEAETLIDLHVTLSNDHLFKKLDKTHKAALAKIKKDYEAKLKSAEAKLKALDEEYKTNIADVVVDKVQAEFDHRAELNAERERVESLLLKLDTSYKKELHAEREKNADANAKIKHLEDGLANAEARVAELDADYKKELDRADGLEKERDSLISGLQEIADADIYGLLEKGKWKDSSLDPLKGKVPKRLHYVIDIRARHAKTEAEIKDLTERLQQYEDSLKAAADEDKIDELKGKIPDNIYIIIKQILDKAKELAKAAPDEKAPHAQPTDTGQQRRTAFVYGNDVTGLRLWISDQFYDLNGRVGEIRGMVKELRRSLFISRNPGARLRYVQGRTDELSSAIGGLASQVKS